MLLLKVSSTTFSKRFTNNSIDINPTFTIKDILLKLDNLNIPRETLIRLETLILKRETIFLDLSKYF